MTQEMLESNMAVHLIDQAAKNTRYEYTIAGLQREVNMLSDRINATNKYASACSLFNIAYSLILYLECCLQIKKVNRRIINMDERVEALAAEQRRWQLATEQNEGDD